MRNYFISKVDGGCELKKQGAKKASKKSITKESLIQKTRQFMAGKEGSVKIRKADGTFQEERTYPRSLDPSSSKG